MKYLKVIDAEHGKALVDFCVNFVGRVERRKMAGFAFDKMR